MLAYLTFTNLMLLLLGAVGLILLYLFWLGVRNPVLFKLGLRNIPRRPTQSVLIVIGLTLSTIIIVSSLATGDTLNHSVQRQAVSAYGAIDEIVAPPLLSMLTTLTDASADEATAGEAQEELERLMEGGLTTVLTVLDGGLPGISMARYEQLRAEAAQEELIDGVAGAIVFPTIIRDVSSGQGEPFGFIFAVDDDYDEQFGLVNVSGEPVEMEALEAGIGNIFGQAANLFSLVGGLGQRLGLPELKVSDVAMATAAAGALLTAPAGEGELDLSTMRLDLSTLQSLGIDTTPLEERGIDELSFDALGLTPETLEAVGVSTTTISMDDLEVAGLDLSTVQDATGDLLNSVNLNTLGTELDRVLGQVGLQLRQGDVYLNRLGAEQLNARVGDVLEVYIGPIPVPFRVKDIVEQAGPMAALAPVVMLRLPEAQPMLFMNDKVNAILVSNAGDELEGLEHTGAVSDRLRVLALDPAGLEAVVAILRRPEVRRIIDEAAPNVMDEFAEEFEGPEFIRTMVEDFAQMDDFAELAEGLPAALDAPGIDENLRAALANGSVRQWLLELDLPAGVRAELNRAFATLNQFDLLDPLSKSTVVTVADVGGTIFSSVFSVFGIFSILAGILLIFLIFVMMAAERRSEMGMARAVGVQRAQLTQMFLTEGMVYDLIAAALGVLLGLAISYAMVGFIGGLFNTITGQFSEYGGVFSIEFRAAPTSVVIAYCLGVLFTFLVVTISAWRVSRLNIVAAIRDLPEPERARRTLLGSLSNLIWALLALLAGGALVYYGGDTGFSVTLAGVSFILLGVGLAATWLLDRSALRPEQVRRLVYTVVGLGLLLIWGVPWGRLLDLVSVSVADGPWILVSLVLTGPMIILGAILVVMYNADLLAWLVGLLLGGIGALTPVLKTAIAYPLSARFRTGMAMLLFAMVISTVTIMTIVIHATQTIVTPDSERYAGFEVMTSATLLSFFNPLRDMEAEMARLDDFPVDQVDVIGAVARQYPDARPADASMRWEVLELVGLNAGYLDQAAQVYAFDQRAPGLADDAAVWEALRTRGDVAVVSPNLLRNPMGGAHGAMSADEPDERDEFERRLESAFWLPGVDDENAELPRLQVEIRQEVEGAEPVIHTVQVIGVLRGETLAGQGVQVNRNTFENITGAAFEPENYYIKVVEGADVRTVAQAVERAFLGSGLNATVMAEQFAQGQALTRGILRLFQGFMALGLLVGIAALGVISSRSVVERRQQIGMLRAIGFRPRMVAVSFLLEASFIALTGLLIGVAAGVILGRTMLGQLFDVLAEGQTFATPWLQIGAIVLAAYLFSLLATLVPAYQASRVYPAEALRYE